MKMIAARIHEFGDPSVIKVEQVDRPGPAAGDVLVQVAGTSFNPTDAALRAGYLQSFLPVDLPYTMSWDVSGTVVELGSGVTEFAVGDRVIGRLDGGGAAAEYVRAPTGQLVEAPDGVPLEAASSLPIAGLTAWQAVFEHGKVAPGQRVLVNGAGGGVGGFVTQLAKYAGAEVIATASPRSAAAVRSQGADQVIDYTETSVGSIVSNQVDTLLNLIAVQDPRSPVSLVRPGGRIISIATPIQAPADSGITAMHIVARNDTGHLAALAGLVSSGVVILDISDTRPLTDLAEIHRLSEAGQIRGKVIITPPRSRSAVTG